MAEFHESAADVFYQQSSGIETAPLQDEVILFHPSTGKFFVLNRTSSFIWSSLREPSTPKQISEKLQTNFRKTEDSNVALDVDTVLQQMESQGLIVKTQT
ncbi:PqqD family protein [bacterium]|nr:PqqD family protein [bacterium]MCI0603573.1 PqqD family protein [bacterium]